MMKQFLMILFTGAIMHTFANPVIVDEKGGCKIEQWECPAIGFGTYPLRNRICTKAVEAAIHDGYRIIDTATYYRNFDAIAKALKKFDRHQIYLISKVWYDEQSPENLRKDLKLTLEELQTDYLDAYFLHWPNHQIPIDKTLLAMEEFRRQKKIRHIGLSNVSLNHVKKALEFGVPITWVQIEMNPFFYDPELIRFCQEKGIAVQAWAPLGRGRVHQDEMLAKIGKKYQKTPCQVALRWILQHKCVPLPGSHDEKHIRENLEILNFVLSPKDMEEMDHRAQHGNRERFTKDGIGFDDEFDFSYEECWPN